MPQRSGRVGLDASRDVAVLLFYAYVDFSDVAAARDSYEALCKSFRLDGRLRISKEGLNGNLSGLTDSCEAFCQYLRGEAGHEETQKLGDGIAALFGSLSKCDFKQAPCGPEHCFRGLKVWVANEVTGLFGDEPKWTEQLEAEISALAQCPAGQHLAPEDFHDRLAQAAAAVGADTTGAAISSTAPAESAVDSGHASDFVLFDARNIYETRVGRFQVPGVELVDPGTRNFSELRSYFQCEENLEKLRGKEVFMYCTGGVRCERSSALLQRVGIAKAVYQLSGGIQRYMEKYPGDSDEPGNRAGFFAGKMHVFDRRGCVAPDGVIGSTEVKCTRNQPSNTISRCLLCNRLWDQYKGKRRCTNCGTLVLVCEHCQSAGRDRRDGTALLCELCPEPIVNSVAGGVANDKTDGTPVMPAAEAEHNTVEPGAAKKPRQGSSEEAAIPGS